MTINEEIITVLILEDSEDDALLLVRYLIKSGMKLNYIICSDIDDFSNELTLNDFDLIISDYDLKGFTGIEAFHIYTKTGKDIPFIMVSGAIGEELAVEAMKIGVHDYVMKDRLHRLVPAIEREIKEARLRQEQVRIEKNLELERQKFQLLVEQAPIGIIIVSSNNQILYSNSMAEEIFGYERKDYDTIPELIPKLFIEKEDCEWVLDFWNNIFDPKNSMPDIDFPMLRSKDGSPKYVKFKSSPISENEFILMAEDITYQKISAITLERSQKRLTQIIDVVEDIVIELIHVDQEFIISSINKSFTEFTGLSKMEILNQKIDIVFKNDELLLSKIREAINRRSTVGMELVVDFKKGMRFWELFISPIYTDDGKLYRIILNARDLTERKKQEIDLKESERKFRIISSSVSDAIWEWRSETGYAQWNEGITNIFGYPEKNIGHTFSWFKSKLHHSEVRYVENGFLKSLKERKENWSMEFRFKCSDDSYKHVHTVAHIFYNEKHKPIKIVGAMTDLTNRMKSEELRIQSLVEGADSERRVIAEELHDNLGQKLSLSSILLDQLYHRYPDDVKLEKVFNLIDVAIQETRSMAHSLMPKTIIDFGLKAGVLSLVNSIKLSHSFQINTYFNFDKERFLPKVETNIFRIIQEALNNIIKHADPNTVFIQITKNLEILSLTIEDDGRGFKIGSEKIESGIGLKNIENRVYYLNGRLTLESNPGKGTLILVEIPLD